MDDLISVLKPIEQANGLPNACYIDENMHAKEADSVFKQGWAAIGFGCDVPKPGCVYPVELLGIPLLMVRTKNNEVHVFENVCRHRGMILVEEPAQLNGPITCPYHAWSYDLEGQLKATPHVGGPNIHKDETVICEDLSLNRVKSALWRDVVFINLSGRAPEFTEIARPLRERWAEFETDIYSGGADSMFTLNVDCNWKLAVENYCEAYHLPFIHPGLNSYSRLEDHYNILDEQSYAGQGSYVFKPQLDENGRSFPVFADLSTKWDTAAEYCAFFPNVLFGVHKDHCYAILLIPNGQGKTEERVSLYYADETALGPEYAEMRATNARLWKGIFIEDIGVVEGMQRGRHAPSYDGGKFSPKMDTPTHHFHKWVAGQMQASR
ncbi:MAG: aromatic ring-hydroxylating oxygenase subunit alpha [Candidatus Puniceispirillaceae bacterium]